MFTSIGEYLPSNPLWYILGIVLFLIIIWIICQYYKALPDNEEGDTFYYQVIDKLGNKSIIHDSGIKPEEEAYTTQLQIVKSEYNDEKKTDLSLPSTLLLGRSPKKLDSRIDLDPKYVIEEKLYYCVNLTIPEDGKRISQVLG